MCDSVCVFVCVCVMKSSHYSKLVSELSIRVDDQSIAVAVHCWSIVAEAQAVLLVGAIQQELIAKIARKTEKKLVMASKLCV